MRAFVALQLLATGLRNHSKLNSAEEAQSSTSELQILPVDKELESTLAYLAIFPVVDEKEFELRQVSLLDYGHASIIRPRA